MTTGLLIMGVSVVAGLLGFGITKLGPILARNELENKAPWLRAARKSGGSYSYLGSMPESKAPFYLGVGLISISAMVFLAGLVMLIIRLIAKIF